MELLIFIKLLTLAENPLNNKKYVYGEFSVSKLIDELIEQIVSFTTK